VDLFFPAPPHFREGQGRGQSKKISTVLLSPSRTIAVKGGGTVPPSTRIGSPVSSRPGGKARARPISCGHAARPAFTPGTCRVSDRTGCSSAAGRAGPRHPSRRESASGAPALPERAAARIPSQLSTGIDVTTFSMEQPMLTVDGAPKASWRSGVDQNRFIERSRMRLTVLRGVGGGAVDVDISEPERVDIRRFGAFHRPHHIGPL